ncbi:UNVERIFIED_CONTAM: SH3 beta-barrel fold-containing protein, partial [Bacteroidetes bacterium 56_B9]
MRKRKKPASIYEALRKKWRIRIMLEKNYTEDAALWMTDRIESLISHMQYGYALVAYYKQDGTFKFVKATLLPYERHFYR